MHDDEFEAIRKLMRLKRHETPGEGFTEDFLREFHRRQQQVAQSQSGLDRFLQMLGDKFESFLNPKFGLAAAAAVIVLVAVFLNALNGPAPAANQPTQAGIQAEDAKKKASEEKDGLKNEPNGVALPASLEKKP
jgi:negative regulator of sigma E activity